MEEIWKDIVGYEGLYQVSNLGNVKSLNYSGRKGVEKVLTPKKNSYGRLWVILHKHGKGKPMQIHRLVAMMFIPNPDNLPQINHKDENPQNNNLENLEWCTLHYNLMYTYERHPEKYHVKEITPGKWHYVGKRKNKRLKAMPIDQYDLDGNLIKQWANSRTILNETGMSDWSISQCCRGKRKTAYGFRWQYAI